MARILLVDDAATARTFLKLHLEEKNHRCIEATDGVTGLELIASHSPDLVILDINMPAMDGIETLKELRSQNNKTPVIMASSINEVDTVRNSLTHGAQDYIVKPMDPMQLHSVVNNTLENANRQQQMEKYWEELERTVETRTRELKEALSQLQSSYRITIRALGSALETRDVETEAHSMRVAHYTLLLCQEIGIRDNERLMDIERGAYLHDIGKIGIPDRVLLKAGPLNHEEWQLMQRHPDIGVKLISRTDFLAHAKPLVKNHHERWDGGGYPDGLRGESIPIEARAFAVADTLDAITSDRPYRQARSVGVARQIIRDETGKQFDPRVVAALDATSDEQIERIRVESQNLH